jgi:hypothetical protein
MSSGAGTTRTVVPELRALVNDGRVWGRVWSQDERSIAFASAPRSGLGSVATRRDGLVVGGQRGGSGRRPA